jgi:hypothetical protein
LIPLEAVRENGATASASGVLGGDAGHDNGDLRLARQRLVED